MMTNQIQTTPSVPQKPQLIKQTTQIKVKRRRSLRSFLISIIITLSIFIVLGAIFFFGVWMHTYKVFTQEKTVAEIYVSKKVIKDGKPTFTVKYIPYDDVSGFWGIFGSDAKSSDEEIEKEIVGDRFMVEADFLKWEDWLTFLNFKPVYKINRITPGYFVATDYERYGVAPVDVNGGPDSAFKTIKENQGKFKYFITAASTSGAGQDVLNQDRTYLLKVTEDALIITEK